MNPSEIVAGLASELLVALQVPHNTHGLGLTLQVVLGRICKDGGHVAHSREHSLLGVGHRESQ